MPANVWLMDGIVVPASVARAANFFATKGENGILLPGDLHCTALPTPGAAVRFAPGTASMVNTFSSAGGGQSYITNLEVSEDLAIPATGSGGGATRRVWQRINDPQYSGSTYNATFGYGSAWPTGFPYVKIATINQPASTATITQAMIVDERAMAVPRRQRDLRTVAINPAGEEELSYNAGVGEFWPNAGGVQQVAVPYWATRMRIIASWGQIFIPANSNPFGILSVRFGPYDGSQNPYTTPTAAFDAVTAAGNHRTTWNVVADMAVPAAIRGVTTPFVMVGKNTSGSVAGQRAKIDNGSVIYMDIEFLEAPAEDF